MKRSTAMLTAGITLVSGVALGEAHARYGTPELSGNSSAEASDVADPVVALAGKEGHTCFDLLKTTEDSATQNRIVTTMRTVGKELVSRVVNDLLVPKTNVFTPKPVPTVLGAEYRGMLAPNKKKGESNLGIINGGSKGVSTISFTVQVVSPKASENESVTAVYDISSAAAKEAANDPDAARQMAKSLAKQTPDELSVEASNGYESFGVIDPANDTKPGDSCTPIIDTFYNGTGSMVSRTSATYGFAGRMADRADQLAQHVLS